MFFSDNYRSTSSPQQDRRMLAIKKNYIGVKIIKREIEGTVCQIWEQF